MSREITTRGLVIGRRSAGEGSVRVLLYTDALGLVEALAKSAREERSKLRAHLQEGTLGTYTLVRGRDVWRVTGAYKTQNAYLVLRERPENLEVAARVIGTVRQFVRGEDTDPYLFQCVAAFLEALPLLQQETVAQAECVVVLRVLSALGYVRSDITFAGLLDTRYDAETLEEVSRMRPALVRAINEGIAASGL